MKIRIRSCVAAIMVALNMVVMAATLASCGKQEQVKAQEAMKELQARGIAIDAYLYAYPLVTVEMTRRVLTNVSKPEGSKAPMGQLARLRAYPAVDDHAVTAPNADTLYTLAWVDVSKEPYILSIPDMKGRFFLFP